jgi:hypothetical protein
MPRLETSFGPHHNVSKPYAGEAQRGAVVLVTPEMPQALSGIATGASSVTIPCLHGGTSRRNAHGTTNLTVKSLGRW